MSIEDIARADDVARPMVYQHFEARKASRPSRLRPGARRVDDHDATFARLAQNFVATFARLEGLRFPMATMAAIDTS